MPLTVLLCTDGSVLADAALAEGLAVLAPPDRVVVATVVDAVDPTLVVGTGMAGGVISPELTQRRSTTAWPPPPKKKKNPRVRPRHRAAASVMYRTSRCPSRVGRCPTTSCATLPPRRTSAHE